MADNRPHWSQMQESGTTYGMKILVQVHKWFGRPVFRLFLYPVVLIYYLLHKKARQSARSYINTLRDFNPHIKLPVFADLKIFLNFAEVMLDKILAWQGMITHANVKVENRYVFEKVNSQKKGSIILISHLGNSDVCSALAHQMPGLRLTILIYTKHAEKFNSLIANSSKSQIEFIQVTEITPATAVQFANRINAGEHIVIAGDRTPVTNAGRVSLVNFMGKKALMPQGGFILANLLKCPVYYLYAIKYEKYHIFFEEGRKTGYSRKNRDNSLHNSVQHFAKSLENRCLQTPLQWFNFYNFWEIMHENSKQP